jgi:hypothetical protein
VKELLHRYPNYLFAEKRARVEGRKHLAILAKEQPIEMSFSDMKDHWYDPGTNIVHVIVDDTLDDEQSLAEKTDALDGEIQDLNFEQREKHGPDVQIKIDDSEIFSMCECSHVTAGRCRWCGRRRV